MSKTEETFRTVDLTGQSYGTVEMQFAHFDTPMTLACGQALLELDVSYETFGTLNDDKSNAVLICHALSGDAHLAGYHPDENPDNPAHKPGWWELYVGPGKAIDTNHLFVICSNVLGGCKGTTGPSSVNPQTSKPFGLDFPVITISDMVDVQKRLVDHLGIEKLLCVLGGSMGGMQALEWAVRYPDHLCGVMPIATTVSLGAQSLAFDAVGRNAILNDPKFCRGDYVQEQSTPAQGLAIARMLGHITYLSEESMHRKFGRNLRNVNQLGWNFNSEFSVETYLDYQGEKFVDRFDANSYLYITRAMDYFDLGEGRGGTDAALASTKVPFLVISFSSDWLFTPKQNRRIVESLLKVGKPASYLNIDEHYGHDSFLLKSEHHQRAIHGFLNRLYHERTSQTSDMSENEVDLVSDDRLDLKRIAQLIAPGDSVLDLGCGDGLLLQYLQRQGCRVMGVDVDQDEVVASIERGVDVVHSDLDQPLDIFREQTFDHVLLSRTLQTVRYPVVVMHEMLRIGKRTIVSFPNFGYWRNRHYIAWAGRVPVSRNLPFSWIDTPNLHHLTLKDFEDWANLEGVRIEQRIAMDYESENQINWLPNLRATDAIYVISKGDGYQDKA